MLLILPKRKIHEIRLEKRIFSIKLLPKSQDWGKGNTNRFTDKLLEVMAREHITGFFLIDAL